MNLNPQPNPYDQNQCFVVTISGCIWSARMNIIEVWNALVDRISHSFLLENSWHPISHCAELLPATLAMEKKKEIITCQPRICSFLCSLARYVGSLFPLVLIYTTRATLMTLMKFISSTCYTQYYRKVYIQCQIRTLEHAIRGKTINRLFLYFFLRVLLANAILDIWTNISPR